MEDNSNTPQGASTDNQPPVNVFQDTPKEQETQSTATQTQSQQLTPDNLVEAFKKAGIGATPAPEPASEPKMTQEEFDKHFNVVKVTKERLQKMYGWDDETLTDERISEFQQLQQDVVRQAVTMAAYQIRAAQEQMMQQMSPALTYARQQQEQVLREEFFTQNPDLKDYEPLLVEIKERLVASGFQGTKEEAFKRISEQAKQVLSKLPGIQLGNPQSGNNNQQLPKPAHRMSTVSAGGQGGAGGTPKASKTGPAAIFG